MAGTDIDKASIMAVQTENLDIWGLYYPGRFITLLLALNSLRMFIELS